MDRANLSPLAQQVEQPADEIEGEVSDIEI